MNKRAVSPLIATIMLIGFSIALGAVVISYGESFVEERADFVQGVPEVSAALCDAVSLQLISVGGIPRVCLTGNIVELSIDNGPEIVIDAVQARIAGTEDIVINSNILSSPLERASSLKTMFTFDSVGEVLQLRLTPVLREGSRMTFCSDKALVVEDLPNC